MVAHLVLTYRGTNHTELRVDAVRPCTLSALPQSRVTSRLLDDLKDHPGLNELAAPCVLVSSEMPFSLIALDCCFADQSHLTRIFTRVFGMSPGALRRQLRD